jgi:hypothetical protein
MRWTKRAAAIGAAVVMMVGASATPAMADDKYLEGNAYYGYMAFIDDGDVFKVCDTKADGYGVTGRVWYDPWVGSGYWKTFSNGETFIDDGGDENCDKAGLNIGNDGNYQMVLYWNRLPDSSAVYSDWFNE